MRSKFFKHIIFMFGIFICMLDTTIMNVSLPSIASDFHTGLDSLSWALNIYTILFASLTIPLTKLSERFGEYKFYIIGLFLFGIGSLLSGISNVTELLLLSRAIQSIGAAIVFPLSMTLGIKIVGDGDRTGVIASLGVTQGLAAALGPVIGGIITNYLSWRWIFFVNIPIVLFILILGLLLFNFKDEKKNKANFDLFGSLLIITFLFSLTLGLINGRTWGWYSYKILITFVISIISFMLFIFTEIKQKDPMIPMNLFKNRQFVGAALVILISNLFLVAVTVILPTYYSNIENYDSLKSSMMLVPITLMIFVTAPLSGFALKKIGARLLISIGFIFMIIGYYGFSNNGLDSVKLAIIFGCLMGIGYGIITGPITIIAASDFNGSLLNSSQSVAGVLRQFGSVLAVSIFVTFLYINLNNAQNESLKYSNESIYNIQAPSNIKNKIISETDKSIKNRNTKNVKKVNTGIVQMDNSINKQLDKIKNVSKYNYSLAFKELYKKALPFMIITILSVFLFKKKSVDRK
ncbi:MFS transporter [Nicoliella lavandulae]|uniref:MFS transporter n=1 Tax=Nicoliella lavandulae TaxID=3082954 RepID=A0ABU8SJ44_9LACO